MVLLPSNAITVEMYDPLGHFVYFESHGGFSYSWSESAPVGEKVNPDSIMIDGVPVVPGDTYRVTVSSFLAGGGSGYALFLEGTNRLGGPIEADALADYLGNNSPVPPGPQDRITRID